MPDHTALIDTPVKFEHDLARPVVIDELELANIACNRGILKPRPEGSKLGKRK